MKRWLIGAMALCLASLAAVHAAELNRLTPEEKEKGWQLLFDGKTTKGWTPNTGGVATPVWKVLGGTLTPPMGPACWFVSTTALPSYDVTGECWSESRGSAMVGIAESQRTPGKPTQYTSTLVFSSGPTVAGKWTGFRLSVRSGTATLSWDGQASPEKNTFDPKATHFQLGYFGPGAVQFRNLKLLPVR